MSGVVVMLSEAMKVRQASGGERSLPLSEAQDHGAILSVRDTGGLAHLVVHQHVPNHVAQRIMELVLNEIGRRATC